MIEIIAIIIFLGSLIGIGAVLFKKIPILLKIPESEIKEPNFKEPFLKLKNKIIESKIFSPDLILQKLFSKIRILTLRVEKKAEDQLQKLREKSKQKKTSENDNYWEELKKTTDKKDGKLF